MENYDYIIIGSGFGGSVSALRLAEKGYKVLVIEKGKWYRNEDFAKTNWNLKKWIWLPSMRFHGIMKMSFYRHISILSGVGVGGGSLVYGNTLPIPKSKFYKNGSWAKLQDWESLLAPFYSKALQMLGASANPNLTVGDLHLKTMAQKQNLKFQPTEVAVFFGEPEITVEDPYFNGAGPQRSGCIYCGACMTGCRHNAKNTLDKNYLHLAQKLGVQIIAEQEVVDVIPNSTGYSVKSTDSTRFFKETHSYQSQKVIFAGGVLGSMKLLLKLKQTRFKNISNQLGENVLSNNESLIFSVSTNAEQNLSQGIAIGSLMDVDEKTHLEVVRYGEKSGFWRLGMLPVVEGNHPLIRFWNLSKEILSQPIQYLKIWTVRDFGKQSVVLLFMQQIDTVLKFKRGIFRLKTGLTTGQRPKAQIPLAFALAREYSKINQAKPMVFLTETLFNLPSTAHILGGAVMSETSENGVVDSQCRLHHYPDLMVCDGSFISANPGVNPSLSIAAITEYAMSCIPNKIR